MIQKVISVNVHISTPSGITAKEFDFPKVTAALEEGYEVKQVIQTVPTAGYGYNLTFILEKKDESEQQKAGWPEKMAKESGFSQ